MMLEQMIENCRQDMVDNLVKLLMFSTVSGATEPDEKRLTRNELSRAFSFLNGLARQMGFTWRGYDNKVGVIEMPGGPEILGLPLHIDVVPSGDGWHYPAFGGMVEDGVIYGRGAQDDKGPVIQMLYALWVLKRLGLPFKRTVRLIIASQEETGEWDDVEDYLLREPPPDMSIVADSDFPIVNGEKGMTNIQIKIRWDETNFRRSVLEFNHLKAGERPNIVPNRADIGWAVGEGQAKGVSETLTSCLEDYLKSNPLADTFPLRLDTDPESELRQMYVTFLGKSAHGSKPYDGHNAVVDALRFMDVVPDLPDSLRRACRFMAEACGDHYGKGLGLEMEHDFIGKTTVNLGILDIDTSSLTAVVNVRPTYGMTSKDVLKRVKARVGAWIEGSSKGAPKGSVLSAEAEILGHPKEPLYVDPKEHPELIGALQTAFNRVTNDVGTLSSMGGSTFAKAFPNAVCFGPVYLAEEKHLAHQADECLKIDHLIRNAKIYGLAIMLLATDLDKAQKSRKPPAGHGLGL